MDGEPHSALLRRGLPLKLASLTPITRPYLRRAFTLTPSDTRGFPGSTRTIIVQTTLRRKLITKRCKLCPKTVAALAWVVGNYLFQSPNQNRAPRQDPVDGKRREAAVADPIHKPCYNTPRDEERNDEPNREQRGPMTIHPN